MGFTVEKACEISQVGTSADSVRGLTRRRTAAAASAAATDTPKPVSQVRRALQVFDQQRIVAVIGMPKEARVNGRDIDRIEPGTAIK